MCRQLKVCTRRESQISCATERDLGSGQSGKGNQKNQKVGAVPRIGHKVEERKSHLNQLRSIHDWMNEMNI